MLPQHLTLMQDPDSSPDPGTETCKYCGVIDRPTLSPGTPPHAIRASCAHCGRFLRWVSVLAPAERVARRAKAKMQAMAQREPSAAQLEFLKALGDEEPTPATMAEASARIDRMVRERQG